MDNNRGIPKGLLASLLSVSLFLCPLATAASYNPASLANSSVGLQITFEPDLPTLEFQTEVPVILGTAVASGGLDELEGGQLPSYERVDCGAINDTICYEICYAGQCSIYSDDDDRVQRFIEKVDEMRDQFDMLELSRIEGQTGWWDTVGSCLKSLGAGLGVAGTIAGLVVAAEPTGILKAAAIGAAVFAGLAGVADCGSEVVATGADREKQQDIVRDFGTAANDAIFEFNDLQRRPPEE